MTIRLRAWCGAAAFALLVPTVAAAQPGNPFSSLFGRAPDTSGREFTAIQFRTTTGAQWGQTLESDFDQAEALPEGLAGSAEASLAAEYIRDRVQATAQGRYLYQEYREEPSFGAPGFDAGGNVNVEVTTRLSLQASGQFIRSPYFQLMGFQPEFYVPPTLPVGNGAILLMGNDTLEANGGAALQLTKRSSISASAFARETRFDTASGYDFSSRGARGTWKRSLTRSLGIRAGYAREELRQTSAGADEHFTNELLDIGVDFSKGFTMGRRTTFAFATETSVVSENGGSRQFRLNGNVAFHRRFLRTWSTELSARRATEFLPGFRAPLFTDRGSVGLAGYLLERLMFQVRGEATRGEVGINDQSEFQSYIGSATLTVAATRHIGIFTQYVYNQYQMPPDPLALVAVPRLSRQAIAIGVKTWVQLYEKKKVPIDPR